MLDNVMIAEGGVETSDKYYYSMEELYRHKDTSNYDQARCRMVSEPSEVLKCPRAEEECDHMIL